MKTIRERIESASEIFNHDDHSEVDAADVLSFIDDNECEVESSDWEGKDGSWSLEMRDGREVVILTPTKDGYRQPLMEWVIVVESDELDEVKHQSGEMNNEMRMLPTSHQAE